MNMILNIIDFEMDIQEAIAAPRIAFIEPNVLAVEPAIPADVRARLEAMGHQIRVRTLENPTV